MEDQAGVVHDIVVQEAPYVLMGDHTEMKSLGIASGACNWDMMKETLMPFEFGIAFPKGTPFKVEFDKMYAVGYPCRE